MQPSPSNLTRIDLKPSADNFRDDVIKGLEARPKFLFPKYFYNQRGSKLYEEICELPEYYPTRTEMAILEDHMDEIRRLIGPEATLIELGCGSSRKIRLILDCAPEIGTYVPIDISRAFLEQMSDQLARLYPRLNIVSICADYTQPLPIEGHVPPHSKRVIFFPGSTIGNLTPGNRRTLFKKMADIVRNKGDLLVGVDLKKDPAVLEKAYNDEKGVTAEFNRNVLVRINEELGGNFQKKNFSHRAVYNPDLGRVEMHLVSRKKQNVNVDGLSISFEVGEFIHTENSYKFSIEEFQGEAAEAGWKAVAYWTDPARLFSLHYFSTRS